MIRATLIFLFQGPRKQNKWLYFLSTTFLFTPKFDWLLLSWEVFFCSEHLHLIILRCEDSWKGIFKYWVLQCPIDRVRSHWVPWELRCWEQQPVWGHKQDQNEMITWNYCCKLWRARSSSELLAPHYYTGLDGPWVKANLGKPDIYTEENL